MNIDKVPAHPVVKQCDVELGLPFLDCHFDVVYHSHVLEHFEVNEARQFVQECFRVLKPAGIIRIAVPDLEQIVLCYLRILQRVSDGNVSERDSYDWIMLELYDQVVRNSSGGGMAAFLDRDSIPNREFIVERCGIEAKNIIRKYDLRRGEKHRRTSKMGVTKFLSSLLEPENVLRNIREGILKILLGSEYDSLMVGRFRRSGENHQWMYDKYSLSRMLEECNFVKIVQRDAMQSYHPGWSTFNLDTEPDSTVYKPDSLYIEAIKP